MSGEVLTIRVYASTRGRTGRIVAFLRDRPVASIALAPDQHRVIDVDLAQKIASAVADAIVVTLW